MESVIPTPAESEPEQGPSIPETEEHSGYRILDTPELRAEYITLTDGLIMKMVDRKIDVAIYLDKSARPVAWLVNALWDTLAPRDNNGNIPPRPETKFLNIDREQWGAIIGRSEDPEGMDVSRLPKERIEELRNLYAPVPGHSGKDDTSLLTGKNVLVIDEVSVSGDTLAMSRGIIKKNFPDATDVAGTYWMSGHVKTDPASGVRKNTKLPVWYSDTQVTGRLVGNRDTTKSSKSNSSRQRTGKYWLSTPFRGFKDKDGIQLKHEVKMLADDLQANRMLYRPASGWDDAELEARLQRINGLSLDDYIALIKISPHDIASQVNLFVARKERERSIEDTRSLGKVSLN